MKTNFKVLFFGRKNDIYSKKIEKLLKKNFTKVKSKWIDFKNKNQRIDKKLFNVDILISFRSYYIFKSKEINTIKKFAINFHPGPPKYRGYGCANYAIYNNDKVYGVTSHIIDTKIDKGNIIDVKYFKINNKNITLNKLLNLTYKNQLIQVNKIIVNIKKFAVGNLKKKKFPIIKEKWSKKIGTKKELDKFYEIKKNISKKNLLRKIRSTNIENFKPYINLYNNRFYYNDN